MGFVWRTGAIGIEALNRRILREIFRLEPRAIETIKNVEHCRFEKQTEIRRGDAFRCWRQADKQFEYIYIAPPQYKQMWSAALKLIDDNMGWLTDDGTAIVQIYPKEYEKIELKNLVEGDRRKYGSTLLIFYDRP